MKEVSISLLSKIFHNTVGLSSFSQLTKDICVPVYIAVFPLLNTHLTFLKCHDDRIYVSMGVMNILFYIFVDICPQELS